MFKLLKRKLSITRSSDGDDNLAEQDRLLKKAITFEFYAPEAKRVTVAGDFNDWNPDALELRKEDGGRWVAQLILGIGRYEYRYVVDGRWCNDQRAIDCAPNSFGSYNNVISLGL